MQFWSEIILVLWFQIELALRAPILKSCVSWFQTKLNSLSVQLPLFTTSNIHNLSCRSLSFEDDSLNHTLSKTPPNSLPLSIQSISFFFSNGGDSFGHWRWSKGSRSKYKHPLKLSRLGGCSIYPRQAFFIQTEPQLRHRFDLRCKNDSMPKDCVKI